VDDMFTKQDENITDNSYMINESVVVKTNRLS